MKNHEFALRPLTGGRMNAVIKKLIAQTGIKNPLKAAKAFLSGKFVLVPAGQVKKEVSGTRWACLSDTLMMVNLGALPNLPFEGTSAAYQPSGRLGWAVVEKRQDGELYVDDRKVILHLSERQQNGKVIEGYNLREELTGEPVLHPNILDALMEHPEFFPESWKKNENGNIRYVYFWAVIFRDTSGCLYVRCVCFDGEQRRTDYFWLGNDWRGNYPAALLEILPAEQAS